MVFDNFRIEKNNEILQIKHKNFFVTSSKVYPIKIFIEYNSGYKLIGEFVYNGKEYMGFTDIVLINSSNRFNLFSDTIKISKENPSNNIEYLKSIFINDDMINKLNLFLDNISDIKAIFSSSHFDEEEIVDQDPNNIICIKEIIELYFDLKSGKKVITFKDENQRQ